MSKPLQGKIALVTGGSRGIGAAVARAFAKEGASVAISYTQSVDKAKAVVAELEQLGVRAEAFRSDQGDMAQAGALVTDVAARFGGLDILVNNAATSASGPWIARTRPASIACTRSTSTASSRRFAPRAA